MRVLLLNQTFYPDVAASAQYSCDLAESLAREGHTVTVVVGDRSYVDPSIRYSASEVWRGIHILRASSSGFGKSAKWRRAVDFATFFAWSGVRALLVPRCDVVIAMTSPPLVSSLGAVIAWLRGARFVYWVLDLNPDEAIAAGWLGENSAAGRILNAFHRFSLRRASHVVALDRFMAARLAAKGVPADRLSVIPLWPLERAVSADPVAAQAFRTAHGLDGKFVVMYSGNHSPCHPLATLLEAALALRGEAGIAFCFVGGGSEFVRVGEFARDNGLANIVRLPYQPIESLSASLSAADLHVVVMGDPFVGIVHPSKVYNILRVGTPFLYIGPELSPIQELDPDGSFRHGESAGVAGFISAFVRGGRTTKRAKHEILNRRTLLERLSAVVGGKSRHESRRPAGG